MQKEKQIKIPLEKFLFNNDYGLLYSCYEIPSWMIFLFSIAEMLEIEEFRTRGSAIAQAVIATLAETEEERIAKEKEPFYPHKGYKAVEGYTNLFENVEEMTINMALTPYTVLSEIFKGDPDLSKLSREERQFIDFFIAGTNKKNIDIYIDIDCVDEIPETAEKISTLFESNNDIKIEKIRVLPNGIAALNVKIKGGYIDHDLILALKPPLKNDLRKNTSSRQKSSSAKLEAEKCSWNVVVNESDVDTIINQDRLPFLDVQLPLSELLLQTARALRFNSVLPPLTNTEDPIEKTDISSLVKQFHALPTQSEFTSQERYLLAQATNEFMVAFLYNPKLFISLVLQLPDHIFPYLNREIIQKNSSELIELLFEPPKEYFSTPKSEHLELSKIGSLLTSTEKTTFDETSIHQKYEKTIKSINEKLKLRDLLEQYDTHTSWYFEDYISYFYFQLLFCPIDIPILQP